MSRVIVAVFALGITAAALATELQADGPKPELPAPRANALRVLDGVKTTFPDKALAEGETVVVDVLQSCHYINDKTVVFTLENLHDAQKRDHVRYVFAKPREVAILNERFKISEAVFAEGAWWLLSGPSVIRTSKYEYKPHDAFLKWSRQTLPADKIPPDATQKSEAKP